jgi:hypothetical protein
MINSLGFLYCDFFFTVFGPNLIRPKEETIETSLELPKVNFLLRVVIDHQDFLFATTTSEETSSNKEEVKEVETSNTNEMQTNNTVVNNNDKQS